MRCQYCDEIIKYQENVFSMEKRQEIEKHLETCQECKSFLSILNLSKNFISQEPAIKKDFYSQISDKINLNRYQKPKKSFKLINVFDKIKPTFKPVSAIASILILVIVGLNIFPLITDTIDKNINMPISILRTDGNRIINEDGSEVPLKGIHLNNNVWGNWVNGVPEELREQGEYSNIFPLKQDDWVLMEDDFKRIKELGCNFVSYGINYQLFAEDNPDKKKNINKLKMDIEKFASMDIYTVVSLMIAPGLDTKRDYYDAYKPGSQRLKTVFEDEGFYSQWLHMWIYLARELKETKGFAGYGLINRPRVPSKAEGGIDEFQKKINNLCNEIRSVDNEHIIFVPEYTSREVSPGETYYDRNKQLKIDEGEQGISWETGFVKVDASNTVYSFEFFEPLDYTSSGIGSFDSAAMEAALMSRVEWVNKNANSPLVAIYGITRANTVYNRVEWLKSSHSLFDKYGIYSDFYEYKTNIGSYVDCKKGFYSLYGEFISLQNEIVLRNGTYDYISNETRTAAYNNYFDELINRYYLKDGKIISVSSLDNDDIIKLLKDYWKY
jgi:hypothetical protein